MAHSMKRIEMLLEIRTNLKIKTFYFIWFNVSRLLFVTVFIQCFKIIICFIWFKFLRIFLSLTYKKLFAFLFTIFTSTPLYTHVYNPSCHPISNTLRQKNDVIYIQPFNYTYIIPTFWYHLILTCMSKLWPRKGACIFYLVMVAYGFDIEVGCCRFCKGCDALWVFGCLRFWFGKVINVWSLLIFLLLFCVRTHNL